MTRVMKQVEVPASVKTQLDYIRCDLCGAVTESTLRWPRDRGEGAFDVNETEVTLAQGFHYPEGGHRKTTRVDICPKCFQEKLLPWLEAQGAVPSTEESDW